MTAPDEAEATVVGIARSILDDPELGPGHNFFERGGDSLLAIELCAELEPAFGVEVSLDLVWEVDSFGELATRLAALQVRPV